jgi:hypothetical protein
VQNPQRTISTASTVSTGSAKIGRVIRREGQFFPGNRAWWQIPLRLVVHTGYRHVTGGS